MDNLIGYCPPVDNRSQCYINFPTTSDSNEFIPIRVLGSGTVYKTDLNRFLFYELELPISGTVTGMMKRFITYLKFSRYGNDNHRVTVLKQKGTTKVFCTTAGMLFERKKDSIGVITIEPLAIMAVKRTYVFDIDKNNIDFSKFTLVVDRKLLNDPAYLKLYKGFKKNYLDDVDKIMDVVYTNDIMNLCYNSGNLRLPKFNTINDMEKYKNFINQQLLEHLKGN
jgi:uncharacterized membrane protein